MVDAEELALVVVRAASFVAADDTAFAGLDVAWTAQAAGEAPAAGSAEDRR